MTDATLVDVTHHDLWGIDADTLATASLPEAVELLWPGWSVVAFEPYLAPRLGAHVAVVLRRADPLGHRGGWAATTLRLGGRDLDAALSGWQGCDDLSRRLAIGWFIAKAHCLSTADLVAFGEHLHGRCLWLSGHEPEEDATFHLPYLWATVCDLPAEVVPEADAARLLWSLTPRA